MKTKNKKKNQAYNPVTLLRVLIQRSDQIYFPLRRQDLLERHVKTQNVVRVLAPDLGVKFAQVLLLLLVLFHHSQILSTYSVLGSLLGAALATQSLKTLQRKLHYKPLHSKARLVPGCTLLLPSPGPESLHNSQDTGMERE